MNWNHLLLMILVGAGSGLALVLAWLAVKYRAWIVTKVKNEKASGILSRLGDFAFKVVTELNQTVVDQLKKDGKWNKEEAEKIKKLALDKLKSYIGAAGLKEAMAVLGISNATLESLLISFIESQVSSLKPVPALPAA